MFTVSEFEIVFFLNVKSHHVFLRFSKQMIDRA